MYPAQLETVARATRFVCARYRISLSDLESHARPWRLVWPRYLAIHLARLHSGLGYRNLGHLFNRNPSAILNALRAVENERTTCRARARELAALTTAFASQSSLP